MDRQRLHSLWAPVLLASAVAGCQTPAKQPQATGAQLPTRADNTRPAAPPRRPTSPGQVVAEPSPQAVRSQRNTQMENHFRRQAEADTRLSLEDRNANPARRFPDQILRHGVGQSHGFFDENERSLPLIASGSANRTVWLPWTTWGKGQYLGNAIQCGYAGEGVSRSILLWHVARPKIDPSLSVRQIRQGAMRELAADVVVTGNCPGTWGEALTLVWGPDAWNQLRNSREAKQSLAEAAEYERMNLEQRKRREAEKAEAWSKLSEKDRCLIWGGVYQPQGELTALGRFWAAQCEGK